MPGAPRTAFAVALLAAGLVAACGGGGDQQGGPAPLSSAPVTAPQGGPNPVGTVHALDAPGTAVVLEPRTATVATALSGPPRVLLSRVDGAVLREVPLPGPAAALALTADGGSLLVPVSAPGSLVQVPLTGGPVRTTDLGGSPRAAVGIGDRIVAALGERLVVLEAGRPQRSITGFADAARLTTIGSKVGVLDRGRSAVSLVDPASDDAGSALRAGNGAAAVVTDRFGRMLVTDVRDGELLVFGGDPLLLRQRYPLPGAPYGLAYDGRRNLAWVTLTARNEVVGLDVAGGEPVVVHRFPTVQQPDAVAVDPVSGRVVLVSASGAGLQVIDPGRMVH
ncbi:MAG: YncE family protein [Pseudonocardiaceae bacterium]